MKGPGSKGRTIISYATGLDIGLEKLQSDINQI
jgi:hypothetical protein